RARLNSFSNNEFSKRRKARPIVLFASALSKSLYNEEKIEISRTCFEDEKEPVYVFSNLPDETGLAEKDFKKLLKIIFRDNKDNKTCRQMINIFKKGKKIVLRAK
ncbi:hypothetical protein MUP35_01650, partial [Patescibacteria group bacterium]|nr:hypothetical protein [Patescibacteria group bacterium]